MAETRGSRCCVVALVLAAGAVAASACSLAFDKYDPQSAVDAGTTDGTISDGPPNMDVGVSPVPDGTSPSEAGAADVAIVDASSDVRTGDGPGDSAACPGLQPCLMRAAMCGAPCVTAYQQCLGSCGTNTCRNNCATTEQRCRSACEMSCVTCTTEAGCADPTDCTTALQD